MGRDFRNEPPPLQPWPPPPAPNFPPWLDRLLWPIAGPHLSWWVAALRATLALRILPFLIVIPLALFLQAMGAPQHNSSEIDGLYRGGGWANVFLAAVILAPLIENFLMALALLFLGAVGLPALWQCVVVAGLAWWAHVVPGETFLAGMWASICFFLMAWQFRIWAPKVGRRRAYLATVATHAVVNGVMATLLWGAALILT